MFNFDMQLYDVNVESDRRVKEILEEAQTKVAKYFRIPRYMLNLKYRISRLPEIYESGTRRVGDYFVGYVKRVGKILGIFNPDTDITYIDPSNLHDEMRLRKTIFHEVVHGAQKILGRIYSLPKYFIEREAHYITERLTQDST